MGSRKPGQRAGQGSAGSRHRRDDVQNRTLSFGYWLRRRRKALDLTQEALAQRVSCSGFAIRKIEADERRPSRALAERLAAVLNVPADERTAFLDAARAIRTAQRLPLDTAPVQDGAATQAARMSGGMPRRHDDLAPLVGRGDEYARLVGLLSGLGAGSGQAVLIEGEPGIGKSRLIREVVAQAEKNGYVTLAAQCYEIERATPYQPVINLVARALDSVSDRALDKLPPVSLAELAALVPELGTRRPGLPQLAIDFPEARLARLPRAVDQLLEAARDGHPAVLVVDDLQWVDEASAQVLHFLARQAAGRPLLVIYAFRDELPDGDSGFARLVDGLDRDTRALRLPLRRLGVADTRTLVESLADPELASAGIVERLQRETDGNPFFLISILQSLKAGETRFRPASDPEPALLPDALRAAVRVRLVHVPKELRPLLESAAVLGRHFDFDTLLAVTQEPESALLDALDSLVRRQLLREEGGSGVYDFSHDKIREVVYLDLGGPRRRLLHQAVAEVVERHDDGLSHGRFAQLAEHFERAQLWSKALQYLVLAGRHSLSLFAMRDALHWLDRAVALAESHPYATDAQDRLALFRLRGAARAQAGETEGAVADIRRVVEAMRIAGDRERTRDALVQLGMAYRRADAYREATTCLNEALAESRALQDERMTADTLYHLGTVAWSTGQNDKAIGHHQQAVEICERIGLADLVAVQAHHGRGEAHFANAEPGAAIASFTRSLALARQIGDKSYECENLMMIGHACLGTKGLGDYARAATHFESALDIARSADLQWHMGPTLLGLDHLRACTGRYGDAWSGLQQTLHWLESLKQVRYQLIAYDFIGHLLLDLGLDTLATTHLQRGLDLGQASGVVFWQATLDANLCIAKSRLGETGGLPRLMDRLEQTRRTRERYMTVRCLEAVAELGWAAGDVERCEAAAAELLGMAVRDGLKEMEGAARRWRGEVWHLRGELEESHAELTRAAAVAAEVGRVSLQKEIELALARTCAAQGETDQAEHHADSAQRISLRMTESLVASELHALHVAARTAAPVLLQ